MVAAIHRLQLRAVENGSIFLAVSQPVRYSRIEYGKRRGWNHLIFIPIDVWAMDLMVFFIPCNLDFHGSNHIIILPGDPDHDSTLLSIIIGGHNDLSRIVCDVIIIIPFTVYIL